MRNGSDSETKQRRNIFMSNYQVTENRRTKVSRNIHNFFREQECVIRVSGDNISKEEIYDMYVEKVKSEFNENLLSRSEVMYYIMCEFANHNESLNRRNSEERVYKFIHSYLEENYSMYDVWFQNENLFHTFLESYFQWLRSKRFGYKNESGLRYRNYEKENVDGYDTSNYECWTLFNRLCVEEYCRKNMLNNDSIFSGMFAHFENICNFIYFIKFDDMKHILYKFRKYETFSNTSLYHRKYKNKVFEIDKNDF